ncbi:cell division protein FtsZ [Altererythrobacter aurantiacus]|uniref:Cell division protein FtsZ n=1 Tax=Parapontixanthobacter aurantiacus TaxID=1463599 RepID=A0A844ZG58_9SPHN|nr:cell division protein FtsZ [Parapontixanthobacter aurantiacus]MXO84709.1 cell division protein FtsZ [Parapontixanthobacter aurantiacus]
MSINIGPATSDEMRPKILVIGVGGAGGNAIANMMEAEIEGVDFIVANTDAQALTTSVAENRIQLGPEITGGLGAGARPEVGKAAAEETVDELEAALEGVNMCFIAAGMGGGTGTGAAPVIAETARKKGVLTVGVVTKPFMFEGSRRMRAAESGIDELQKHVDTLIVIPNQNLFLVAKAETTFKEAFQLADEVLQQGVRSITDLMVMPGLINLDFADVRSVMQEMGKAMMGTGEAEGENRALEAAERAIANPLLDGVSMQGAKGVIISIIGGEDMRLLEVDEAANHIRELVDDDANIIWGSAFNPDLEGRIRVSVVATGIDHDAMAKAPASEPKPFALSDTKPPKRPVLELSNDDTSESDEAPLDLTNGFGSGANESEEEDESFSDPVLSDPLGAADFDEDEEDDDVDDIVDPLAGLRNREDEDDGLVEPAQDREHGSRPSAGFGEGDESGFVGSGTSSDENDDDALVLGEDNQMSFDSPLRSKPQGRKRGMFGGSEDEEGSSGGGRSRDGAKSSAAAGGSTLFERMANLSRGSNSDDEDEDDDDNDGSSLNIPRFLGRQNNQ